MDLLESSRRRVGAPAGVAAALVLLAAGQAAALAPRPLPEDVRLSALPNGYSYTTDGKQASIGFQLTNAGSRPLRVESLGDDLPGLSLVDVSVSGEPFDFDVAGDGEQPLPSFELEAGTVVEVRLVYRLRACSAVPRDTRPMPAEVRQGRRTGTVPVELPRAPSSDPDAAPEDEDEWQVVLVRDLCE